MSLFKKENKKSNIFLPRCNVCNHLCGGQIICSFCEEYLCLTCCRWEIGNLEKGYFCVNCAPPLLEEKSQNTEELEIETEDDEDPLLMEIEIEDDETN